MDEKNSGAQKDARPRRGSAYRRAFVEAQTVFPDDMTAQHRIAARAEKRASRREAKKKE